MAMVADERTSVFGNFHVVTGTYDSGGGTLDLSGQFSSIIDFKFCLFYSSLFFKLYD